MKDLRKPAFLLPVILVGFVAQLLRRLLYWVAVDEKNLLVSNHPLEIALWIAVLTGAILVVAALWKAKGMEIPEENSPALVPALGHGVMAGVILMMLLGDDFRSGETVSLVQKVLGIVCVPGLVWNGICRVRGKTPCFLFHGAVSLFLLMHLICQYRMWSANPQLQDYVFDMLAGAALTLFGYYCAADSAGMGNRLMQLATGLMGMMLSIVALSGTDYPALFVGGAIWAATNLHALTPRTEKEERGGDDSVSS